MQVLQVRIADALEDEVLGQALLEERVGVDGIEMRQALGHRRLGLRRALPVVGLGRGAARLLGEFRLAQPITLALNGNDLRMMGEPINERHGTGCIGKDRVPLLERQIECSAYSYAESRRPRLRGSVIVTTFHSA